MGDVMDIPDDCPATREYDKVNHGVMNYTLLMLRADAMRDELLAKMNLLGDAFEFTKHKWERAMERLREAEAALAEAARDIGRLKQSRNDFRAALAEAQELNKRAVYGCCEECGVVDALAEARRCLGVCQRRLDETGVGTPVEGIEGYAPPAEEAQE